MTSCPLHSSPPRSRRQSAAALVLWLTLSALAGCRASRSTPPEKPPLTQGECTLETPLVPGIPGSPGHEIPSARNPNGDSELAVLMRDMLHDLQRIRPSIAAARTPANLGPINHKALRCSWPNEPAIRGPVFDALATSYLTALNQLKLHTNPPHDAYNGVVAGCLGCHNQFCPGPIHLIQNLWID